MVTKGTGSFLGTTIVVYRNAPKVQISFPLPSGCLTLAKSPNLPPFPIHNMGKIIAQTSGLFRRLNKAMQVKHLVYE